LRLIISRAASSSPAEYLYSNISNLWLFIVDKPNNECKIKNMRVNGKEYITVKEMADRLKIEPNTVKQRLFQHDIKPVSKDALYELSALEAIKDTTMGRPKKDAVPEPAKPKTKLPKAKPAKKVKGKK
jgi:hypothetical protein